MKRFLLGVLATVAILSVVAYLLRMQIAMRLVERAATSNLTTNLLLELPDGLHVVLCGAGSPLPDPMRSGPCTAIVAGKRLYIVDAGSGSSRVLSRVRLPQGEIDGMFLTHFHSDHIDGLGELLLQRWANGATTSPLPVYGPEGVEQVVAGFELAYSLDRKYRIAHHGEEVVPPSGAGAVARPFQAPADGEAEILVDQGDLRVSVFRVSHEPVEPAVGYRFDYKGRSVVLSGDTRKSANVEKFAEGVKDVYKGPVTVGRDGTLVELPAGDDTIEVVELL
ncbi:MAG: hypothetical protein KatS3mg076_3286 [Candidatus Binatia bacterium]|nr:MAG: hypothetical protein KatS3mg076_3286 [Candidatus Binatia bacterium]